MPNSPDRNYLEDVIASTDDKHFGSEKFFGFNEFDKPAATLRSSDISLANWREGKCEEVQQKIKDARGLFNSFKSIARQLADILASDHIDESTESRVAVLYKKMEELRKQILAAYPEVFDSWEISIAIKWEFPKDKIFIDKNLGPLFSLLSVVTPHIQWQAGGAERKVPQGITYKTKYPNFLVLYVKSVPAEFCASPYQLQAYGSVGGNAMNTFYVHLVTHRSVQLF